MVLDTNDSYENIMIKELNAHGITLQRETIISICNDTSSIMTHNTMQWTNKSGFKTIAGTRVRHSCPHIALYDKRWVTYTNEYFWMIYDTTDMEKLSS